MAAIGNITVFDGAPTPVSHTFTPVSVSREGNKMHAVWREIVSTVPDYAQNRIEATISVLKSGVKEIVWKVVVPVMEPIAGQNSSGYTAAPKVAYEDTDKFVSYVHPRSTMAGRRLTRMLLVNIANNVGTSVPAATGGSFVDMFDNTVFPT